MSDNNQDYQPPAEGDGDEPNVGDLFDQTEEAPVQEAPKPKRRVQRRTAKERSTVPLYSLDQVARIIDFTHAFDDASTETQLKFLNAFGWSDTDGVDGLRVAPTVLDNPHEVQAFRAFSDLVGKLWAGPLGFAETIALVGTFTELEANVIGAFTVIVNSVLDEGEWVVYNSRTQVADLLGSTVAGLEAHKGSEDIPELVVWIDTLFTIWPGDQ